jgi:hypothetical protein
MFVKDLKFGNGIAFFRETQIYLFPANYVMACFKLGCDNFEPGVWKRHLREFTFDDSYILYNKFKDLPRRQIFNCFLDYIKYFGFGEVNLSYCNDKKILFTLVNDSYGGYYQKLYDEVPKVLPEEIIAGFLENYFSLVYGKTLICNIVKVSRGYNFELEITGEDFNLVSNKFYPEFETGMVSLPLKKLLLHKAITFEKGFFLVSENKGFMIPYFFLLNFMTCLNLLNLSKSLDKIIYLQGKAAVDLHNFYGVNLGDDSFNSVFGLQDISGLGLCEVSENKLNYKLLNNCDFYSKFYSNLFIFNLHIMNLLKGIYDSSYLTRTKFEYVDNNLFKLINNYRELILLDDEIKISEILGTRVLISDKKF